MSDEKRLHRISGSSLLLNENEETPNSYEETTNWKDCQTCLPTILILVVTLIVTVTVIPYAFSTVFSQIEAADRLEAIRDEYNLTETEPIPDQVIINA